MLSMGAFAQTPIGPPTNPGQLCVFIAGFVPECNFSSPTIKGSYILKVCGVSMSDSTPLWEARIQKFICENGFFPDYVKVHAFNPGLIREKAEPILINN